MGSKNPERHNGYPVALSKLSELNNKLLNDPSIKRNNKLNQLGI